MKYRCTPLLGWVVLAMGVALIGCQHVPPVAPGLDGQPLTLNEHTLYVDGQLKRDWPKQHIFHSLHTAIAAAPVGTEQRPTTIYLAPNVYWMNGTETDRGLYIHQDWIRLVGLSDDPRDVVLGDNRGHTIGAHSTSGSSPAETLFVTGTGFSAENLTIGNYCNVDLVYPRDPSKNRTKRSDTITQAYVIGASSEEKTLDKFVFRNVRFISMLDTLALGAVERAYFDGVYVQGTDDYIGGGDVHVFEHSVLHSYTSKPLYTAGRHGTAFIDSRWEVSFSDPQDLWLSKNASTLFLMNVDFVDRTGQLGDVHWSPYPKASVNSYQYGVTVKGEPYRILPTNNGRVLNAEQKPAYSAAHLLAGDDGWNPTGKPLDSNRAHEPLDIRLSGPTEVRSGEEAIEWNAAVFPKQATGTLNWSTDNEALAISELDHQRVQLTGEYDGESPIQVSVSVRSDNGLENHRDVTVYPRLLPAPDFDQKPKVHITSEGEARVEYALNLDWEGGERPDRSQIRWYRLNDPDDDSPVPVAVGRSEQPLSRYPLTRSDVGHYLMAMVAPQHNRSQAGAVRKVITERAVRSADLAPGVLSSVNLSASTLQSFPVARQSRPMNEGWIRDTFYPEDQRVGWTARPVDGWHYGVGVNGADGRVGLMPAAQGARLLYTRDDFNGDMSVEVALDTEKTAGQGFGSPNGQYLEVYIRYDTRTQSGYALRIERTARYGFATDFTLYRYENGTGTPISESVASTAFNPGSHIHLAVHDDRLVARVTSDTAQSSDQKAAGLPAEVKLEASLGSSVASGGFGLQHTGTVGPGGRFVLHQLTAHYRDDGSL